jgi:hypothetical protein
VRLTRLVLGKNLCLNCAQALEDVARNRELHGIDAHTIELEHGQAVGADRRVGFGFVDCEERRGTLEHAVVCKLSAGGTGNGDARRERVHGQGELVPAGPSTGPCRKMWARAMLVAVGVQTGGAGTISPSWTCVSTRLVVCVDATNLRMDDMDAKDCTAGVASWQDVSIRISRL